MRIPRRYVDVTLTMHEDPAAYPPPRKRDGHTIKIVIDAKRQRFTLTDQERATFTSLSGRYRGMTAHDIWVFWQAVAAARGLDYKSVIGNPNDATKFSALPLGHGKHWCWPSSLNVDPPGNAPFH